MRKILIAISFVLVAGCQYLEPKLPLLDDPVCEPPCWQNIIPGRTEKEDLLNQLSTLPFVDKSSISSVNIPGSAFAGTIYASLYLDKPYQTKLYSYFLNDKVAVISLGGTWHVTLAEAIEKLGKPRTVIVVRNNGDAYVTFINPATGISFGYTSIWKDEKWKTEISPDIEIESINFFDPNSYQGVLNSGIFSWWFLDPEQTANVSYSWIGYGKLDEKYPPRHP